MIQIVQEQAGYLAALRHQAAHHAPGVRADARRSSDPTVEVLRACLRGYAAHTAAQWAQTRADAGHRTDSREVEAVAGEHLEMLASVLGLRSDAHEVWRVDANGRRVDSYVLSGDLTDRDRSPIRRPDPMRVLKDWFPRRNVAAWAERATRVTTTGTGGAKSVRAGDTDIPVVDVSASEDGVNIQMAAVQTIRPWGMEMSEARNAINVEAEKLHYVMEAHADWATLITTSGIVGTSAVGAEQLPIPTTAAAINYGGTPTMDQIRADFLGWLRELRVGSDGAYRSGEGPFNVALGGRLAFLAFERPSNYAAGGSATGANILASISNEIGMLRASGRLGTISVAPELEGLGYGAGFDVAIAVPAGRRTIEQPVAIDTPIPVYTYRGPGGDATYWITRRGGLDVISDIGTGRYIAQVA